MEKQKKKQTGITLIALVISIIVMLILAGVSLNITVGDNGILTKAKETNIKQRLVSYKENFEMNLVDERIKNGIDEEIFLYAINDKVKTLVTNLQDIDVGTIAIYDSQLIYIGDVNSQEGKIAQELGFLTMTDDDYNYMLELNIIERAVKKIQEQNLEKVGLELGTASSGKISIAGIDYGLGWYEIGSNESTKDSELTALGITAQEKVLMIHSPYIVKYSTGAVQCVSGKIMYDGMPNAIWKYSFNYTGEKEGLVVSNILTGVTQNSPKTKEQFGEFKPTKECAESGASEGVIESYYVDDYTYDEDGGVILTKTTNILSLPIDQTKKINEQYSVSITFKCEMFDENQGYPSYRAVACGSGGCLLAISDLYCKDVCDFRVWNGLFKVITFRDNSALESNTSVGTGKGYGILDLSDYNNKYVNVIVTAKREGKTKVYINGNLCMEFQSGSDIYSYKTFTIGDLRPGRGMKYLGTVYNYALYGDILTDDEISQNWNYIKQELGINEAGDKVVN